MNKILKKQAVQLMNCLFFIFLCGNCLAQKAYPEIRVSYISELQKGIQDSHWILDSDLVSSPGMIPFGNGNYTDSLINHLDTIQPADWRTPKGNYPVFLAIWGNDTLSYARLPDTRFYYRNDDKQKKKIRVLEVESQLPPYTRFAADVEGLSEKEISALTDSMKRMKSPQDTLMNCPQACFFYALDAFFRTHGICPDPVITRNTNFSKKEELAAFFEHFLKHTADYPCHYKKVKDVSFPDNSVIVIVNGYNEIIHAVFYHDGLFHTKNGLLSPFVYSTIRPILKGYGSKDNPGKDLSKTGKLILGQTLKVYTLNDSLYHLHQ